MNLFSRAVCTSEIELVTNIMFLFMVVDNVEIK